MSANKLKLTQSIEILDLNIEDILLVVLVNATVFLYSKTREEKLDKFFVYTHSASGFSKRSLSQLAVLMSGSVRFVQYLGNILVFPKMMTSVTNKIAMIDY